MKVLVTGVKGQLGHDVMNELAKRGYEGVGVDVEEMDITDEAAVRRVMEEVRPDKWCTVQPGQLWMQQRIRWKCAAKSTLWEQKILQNVRGAGYSHDLPQYRLCV